MWTDPDVPEAPKMVVQGAEEAVGLVCASYRTPGRFTTVDLGLRWSLAPWFVT